MVELNKTNGGILVSLLVVAGALFAASGQSNWYECQNLSEDQMYKQCDHLSSTLRTCYFTDDQKQLDGTTRKTCPDGGIWTSINVIPDLPDEPTGGVVNVPSGPAGAYTLNSDGTCNIAGNIAKEFRGTIVNDKCVV